ncbi:MAG: Flp family type IVb pilin [Bacillota bacterium]
MQMIRTVLGSHKGQGMVEYSLILTLVAVALVAAFTALGTDLSESIPTVTQI